MSELNIKAIIEKKLNEKFVSEKNEWAQTNINSLKVIDIIIVSDCICARKEVIGFIEEIIMDINIKHSKDYIKGIIRKYTIQEAAEVGVKKLPDSKMNISTFSELINYNSNRGNEIKDIKKKSISNKIISFYSYKGGVGRTVALIQTAYLLAENGKRVLLIDLDIEAPSFYDIFRESIKKDYGIVDYLYDNMYNVKKTITLENIISKLNMNLKGEIFLIPAGKITNEYVTRLEKLKEKRIYENQYIQDIIKETKEKYNIDYTLIDSRTGINNWGALSLIDIAQEVMLFAYPNKENIAGLKLIKELIGEYKKTTIILSRIDASEEGFRSSERLFKELNLEQEYISILYNPAVATASEFPIKNVSKPYDVISNFILEDEENAKVSNTLEENKDVVIKILEMIKNFKIGNSYTTNEYKITQESNSIVICERDIFDEFIKSILISEVYTNYELDDSFSNDLNEINFDEINFGNDSNIEVEKFPVQIIDDTFGKIRTEMQSYIAEQSIDAKLNYRTIIFAYLLKLIQNSLKTDKIMNYSELFDEINIISKEDLVKNIDKEFKIKNKMIVYFSDILNLFDETILNDIDTKICIFAISAFNYVNSYFSTKLIIDFQTYNKYRDIIDTFDTNILKLSWKSLDEKDGDNVTKEIKEYINLSLRDDIEFNIVKHIIKKEKELKKIDFYFETLLESKYSNDVSKIVFGVRSNPNIYSKEIITWIYKQLKERDKLTQEDFIKFIKKSAELELRGIESKEDYSRMLSLNSMEKALGEL